MNPILVIGQSFYSSRLYRQVRTWKGQALGYLALTLLLCWAPSFGQLYSTGSRGWQQVQEQMLNQLPELRIENGRVTTPEKRPYVITLGSGKDVFTAIIDTSGSIVSLEGQSAQMLLTSTKFFARKSTNETRVYDLSTTQGKTWLINRPFVERVARKAKPWVFAGIVVVVFIASYIKRLIQAFVMGLFGLLLSSWFDADFDLNELFSVAIVAMTPVMVIQTIIGLTTKPIPYQWLLWLLIYLGYFVFAVNAASEPEPIEPE